MSGPPAVRLDAGRKAALLRAAREAAPAAYCPFSKFRVGAAALAADGRVFTGCNIENASFGLTICAERLAVWKAVSEGATPIVALALAFLDGPPGSPAELKIPCGACRQVMAEFAGGDMILLLDGAAESSLAEIFPRPFRM